MVNDSGDVGLNGCLGMYRVSDIATVSCECRKLFHVSVLLYFSTVFEVLLYYKCPVVAGIFLRLERFTVCEMLVITMLAMGKTGCNFLVMVNCSKMVETYCTRL